MENQLDQNNRLQALENRLLKVEAENIKLKNLFDSLFSGSNDTKIYFKRQIAFDKQALIGFFGKDPIKQPVLSATATDPATTQTLANSIRTALITLGLTS